MNSTGGKTMKRIALVAAALLIAPAAMAQLYKHVDKDGRTVYTDQPPANVDAKRINVPNAPAPASGNKSYVERDKELEKGRKAAREKQEKSEKATKSAQEAEQKCAQAKTAYQAYADGGRIYKYNEKGERTYLGDAELETERDRTRREMEEACKNS
jgi:hypothetical protein